MRVLFVSCSFEQKHGIDSISVYILLLLSKKCHFHDNATVYLGDSVV